MVTLRRNGVAAATCVSILLNPPTPAAASVFMGPAEMAQIATWMSRAVDAARTDDEASLGKIAGEVDPSVATPADVGLLMTRGR